MAETGNGEKYDKFEFGWHSQVAGFIGYLSMENSCHDRFHVSFCSFLSSYFHIEFTEKNKERLYNITKPWLKLYSSYPFY